MEPTIVRNPVSFDLWHVINGLWVHIGQTVTPEGRIRYFVDGVEQFADLPTAPTK
jgi:hypothetical protein